MVVLDFPIPPRSSEVESIEMDVANTISDSAETITVENVESVFADGNLIAIVETFSTDISIDQLDVIRSEMSKTIDADVNRISITTDELSERTIERKMDR